jgi:hypothetical protein
MAATAGAVPFTCERSQHVMSTENENKIPFAFYALIGAMILILLIGVWYISTS